MRAILYETLSGLPSKIVGNAIGIGGMVATAWPESFRRWVSANMTPEQIRFYGMIGVALFVVYWVLMLWLRPKDELNSGSTDLGPKTFGSHSPAMTVQGNGNTTIIHNHPKPAEKQEHKDPRGFNSQLRIQGQGDKKPTYQYDIEKAAKASQALAGQRDPAFQRNMKLGEVAEHVAAVRGFQYVRETELEIADMVKERRMHIWGRKGNNPIEMLSTHCFNTLQVQLQANRVTTLGLHAVHRTIWNDVQFSREEVEMIWQTSSG